jgi:phosphotransferase system HPr (HPr) family protein
MITVDATFRDRYGLHPRAAMRIQQTAAAFSAKMTVQGLDTGTAPIPASTMIGLVSAGIRSGERVRVMADGTDEADAAEALRSLLETGVCHP